MRDEYIQIQTQFIDRKLFYREQEDGSDCLEVKIRISSGRVMDRVFWHSSFRHSSLVRPLFSFPLPFFSVSFSRLLSDVCSFVASSKLAHHRSLAPHVVHICPASVLYTRQCLIVIQGSAVCESFGCKSLAFHLPCLSENLHYWWKTSTTPS